MIDKTKVKGLVDQWLEGKDYFLTDLSISDDDRIVVEIDHKEGVWIEDCVELSKFIESNLDRDVEDYELEVGSAGIGQPFKVRQQYENNVGSEVEAVLNNGKKTLGILKSVDDRGFTLTSKEKIRPEGAKRPKMVEVDHSYAFDEVKEVRAVIKF
ncbi:MAG: ribosome assembly cofactor RimP [Bacteroidaceae bacterium]